MYNQLDSRFANPPQYQYTRLKFFCKRSEREAR